MANLMKRGMATAGLAATAGALALGAATPAHASTVYTVKAGDTVSALARTYHSSVAAIGSTNHLRNVNLIYVGEKLVIPSSTVTPPKRTTPVKPTPVKPAPKPVTGSKSIYAPGTSVSYKTSTQVAVATHTSGHFGTWARYQWEGTSKGWVKVSASSDTIWGEGGIASASARRQGDHKTPLGTFPIEFTFGRSNPGAKMAYKTIGANSWWDERPSSATYNRWIEGAHGCTEGPCEHLATYENYQYQQAAVIGYNYSAPLVRSGGGSGAGIFLHYARSYTEGCVGLNNLSELTNTIKWFDPAQHPKIVIKN